MNTFYIARHGETENNKSKRLSGWIQHNISEAYPHEYVGTFTFGADRVSSFQESTGI